MFKKIKSLSFIIYFFLNVGISFSQPFISPDEINVLDETTIDFYLSEELNLSEGAIVTGFSVSGAGTITSAFYYGKDTFNEIFISGSGFIAGVTTISYTSSTGNVLDNKTGSEMVDFSDHPTIALATINLVPGDIAFTSYRADSPDMFSFVLLKDVEAGTEIKFTDKGWDAGRNSFTTAESGGCGQCDDIIKWTALTDIYAGTEFIVDEFFIFPSSASLTFVTSGSGLNLSGNGDQVLAYQGTVSAPLFIAAINEDNSWASSICCGGNDDGRTYLPIGLVDGIDALLINNRNGAYDYFDNPIIGSKNSLLVQIMGSSLNWTTAGSAGGVTWPIGGDTYFLPPNVTAFSPTSGSRIGAGFSTLQITFDENVTKDLSFGGNIEIYAVASPTNILVISYPISNSNITVLNNAVSIDISSDLGVLVDETIYVVHVDGFLFVNADGNHNAPIVGSSGSEWLFTYDSSPPTVSSISRANANPHNAGVNAGSVDFTVTFNESVNNVDVTDFTVSPSSINLVGTPTVAGVSASSGTVFTVTVNGFDLDDASAIGTLNLDLNPAGTITDEAGNDNVSDVVTGLDETYTIINPEPTESISSLTSSFQTGASINLDWTNSIVDQISFQHLLLVKETAGTFPPVSDGSFVNDDLDISEGVLAINVGHGISSYEVTGLNSGVTYNFEIYPYTNDGTNVDYNTTTPATLSQTTLLGSTTSIAYSSAAPTISSLTTNSGLAVTNFAISITDDGASPGIDNAPTLINQLIISRNDPDDEIIKWTEAIANAELSDGVNTILATSVDDSNITFSGIPNSNGTLGEIDDNQTKIYYLKIWLKSDLSGSLNLPQTIDGLNIVFKIETSNITVEPVSSNFAGSTISSGTSNNEVTVIATQLDFTTNPNPVALVLTNLTTTPIVEANDANDNRDLDFGDLGETVSINNPEGILMVGTGLVGGTTLNAVDGIINFPADFQYQDDGTAALGNGTLLVTNDVNGFTLAPPVSPQTVTVSYDNINTVNDGALLEPALITSLLNASPGVPVFDFIITDDAAGAGDGSPTRISQIVIASGPGNSVTNWTEAIAVNGATLSDGINTITGAVTDNAITFSPMDFTPGSIGYIADNTPKTYTLRIWLNSVMGGSLGNDIDNLNFVFEITDENITLDPISSLFTGSESENSGVSNNAVDVVASKLVFNTPPASTANYDADLSIIPVVTSIDENNNVDHDYLGPLTITNVEGLTMNNHLDGNLNYSNGIITFNANFQYTVGGLDGANGTLTVSDGIITDAISSPITVSYSALSDIIEVPSFNHDSNIPYTLYQANTDITNGNSIVMEQFSLRDGGASALDNDGTPTILNVITMQVGNWQNLRRIELYDAAGTTALTSSGTNEQVVTGESIIFSGLSLSAPDNGTVDFTVRVSFHGDDYPAPVSDTGRDPGAVDDNEVISFTVIGIAADPFSSKFEFTDAGGATSTLAIDENRIEVVADRVIFTSDITTPISTYSSIQVPGFLTVKAKDQYFSTDTDYSGAIGTLSTQNFTPTASLTFELLGTPLTNLPGNFTAGVYDFAVEAPSLQYTLGGLSGELIIAATGLTDGISETHNVFSSEESTVELNSPSDSKIPYKDHTLGSSRFTLVEFKVKDGGVVPDDDEGSTVLSDITISLTNSANLTDIALYDDAETLIPGTIKTPTSSVTWSGLSITAPDNSSKTFSIKAFFSNVAADNDPIDIEITSISEAGGSKFAFPDGSADGLGGAQSTPGANLIDVVATQLDFHSTLLNINQEVGLPIMPNQPQVFGNDANGNLDLDFSDPAAITSGVSMSTLPANFSNGILNFPGFTYTSPGDGTLTVIANGLTGTSNAVTVNSVSITGITSSTGNGTYYESATLNIEAIFSQNATLFSGSPTLALNSGGTASYVSGSPSGVWVFAYTIGKDEVSADLEVTSFNLNGAVLQGPLGNALNVAIPTANSLAVNQNIIVELFNHAPLVNPILSPTAIEEDALEQIIGFTGIADGNSGLQTVISIVATSNNTALIPDPLVTYAPGATDGSLAYTPVTDASGTATITLVVADNGGTANGGIDQVAINFDVVVNPVNDTPTISDATFSVDENSANGTVVGTMLFGDIDSNTFNFSITSGNTNNVFTIDNLGVITVASIADLNFEVNPNYELVIQIEDDAITPLSASATLTINVNDVNDVPSDIILGVDETTIFISDPTPSNTFLRTIRAVDEDFSLADQNFSLPSDETDNAAFSIVLDAGDYKLSTKQEINSTIKSSFNIRIRYDDGLGGSIEEFFTVAFGSGNIPPSEINMDNKSVFERLPTGALVGTLSTIDPDDTIDDYAFVTGVGGEDNGSFLFDGDRLITNEVFDFLIKSSYSILLKSTDSQNQSTQNFNFIITIDQFINNAPTDINISSTAVDEKLAANFVIGTLSAADIDIDDIGINQTIEFNLVSGTGGADNASFSITGNELRTAEVFDYATQSSYSIRIQALDSDGGIYEEVFEIMINDITPPLLISKSPAHNEVDVPINPTINLTFNEAVQPGSGNIIIKKMLDDSMAESFDVTSSAIVFNSTTIQIDVSQDLSDGIEYYITIDATAIEDLSSNSFVGITANNEWSFTTIDQTPPQISADPSNPDFIDNGAGSITLTSSITDNSGSVSQVTFNYKMLSDADAEYIPVITSVDGDDYSVEIPESMFSKFGIDYKFEAQDESGNSANPLVGQVYFRFGDSEIDQEPIPDLIFGGRVKDYQVISIPYKLEDTRISSVFNELIALDNTGWRLLRHNSDGISLKEYPQSLNLIELGKSYWLNVKTSKPININAREVTSHSQSNPFEITLVPGWNQIGNPYPFDISWNDIVIANPTLDLGSLRIFNNESESIVDGAILETWGGGFVAWSGVSNADLIIPLKSNTGGRLNGNEYDFTNEGWITSLHLSSGKMQTNAGFGMHPDAIDSKDRFDKITAPRFFNYLELNFYHIENVLPKFSTDIGKEIDNKVWKFSIETNALENISLSWGPIPEEINGRTLILRDVAQNRLTDMNAMNSYVFSPSAKSDFEIAFGDESFVNEMLMPSNVTLGSGLPNPFSSHTLIPFTIPNIGTARVTLTIYDLLGNEIIELLNDELRSGYHEVRWNGTDSFNNSTGNGIYIYRLYIRDGVNDYILSNKLLKIGK